MQPVSPDAKEHTFIDLFAGIGGIRLGFEQAGFRCVFTSEWDKFARETYQANFVTTAEEFGGDITKLSPSSIPDHDVLTGGFPCQPFSLAGVSKKNSLGKKHGFMDETQGTLFFNIAEILDVKRPKAFVLENVKNLRSHDKGRTFSTILSTLRNDLGYTTTFKLIDASEYVPQKRQRIFIVGFADPNIDFIWPEIPNDAVGKPKIGQILHSSSEIDADNGRYFDSATKQVLDKYTLTNNLWMYLQQYAEKHRNAGNGFGFGLVGPDDVARTLSARYHKDGSEILVSQGASANPRRLTPRECARLMGFPDSFEIPVSDTQAYRQFGNSVVVPVIQSIAAEVAKALG